MNKAMKQVVDTVTDLVADHPDVQLESSKFALQEMNRTEVPDESDPMYQFYWELVATFITKVLIQAAQNQRLVK
jgi:hypothetical protein